MSNEIPLKQWIYEEAERKGVKPHLVEMRLSRGKYPHLKKRYLNKRVVMVEVEENLSNGRELDKRIRKAVEADFQQLFIDSLTPDRGYITPIDNVRALILELTDQTGYLPEQKLCLLKPK